LNRYEDRQLGDVLRSHPGRFDDGQHVGEWASSRASRPSASVPSCRTPTWPEINSRRPGPSVKTPWLYREAGGYTVGGLSILAVIGPSGGYSSR